jgi:hypothetical protein
LDAIENISPTRFEALTSIGMGALSTPLPDGSSTCPFFELQEKWSEAKQVLPKVLNLQQFRNVCTRITDFWLYKKRVQLHKIRPCAFCQARARRLVDFIAQTHLPVSDIPEMIVDQLY